MLPFADLVRELAGITSTDDRREARDKVAGLIGRTGANGNTEGALASLLDLGDAVRPLEDIYRGVRLVLESQAQSRPTVLAIEDLHHADPASLDMVEYLLRATRGAAVLIIGTARPEFVETRASMAQESGTTLLLSPLPTADVRTLIDDLIGQTDAASEGDRIEEAAEGNPLFVEQLALMLHEHRDGPADRPPGADVGGRRLVVPPSISALLDARVDRLSSDERIVAQRASVLGRTFDLEDVTELLPEGARSTLTEVVQRLARKGILQISDPSGSQRDVSFAHGLIRDSAYRSLLKSQRAELHERCADHLERSRGGRVAEHAVMIGSQLEAAVRNRLELASDIEDVRSLSLRAARWLATAGRNAMARGDARNAEDLLERTAALLPEESPERLAVLADLGMARSDVGQLTSAEEALAEVVAKSRPDSALHWRARVDLAQLVFGTDPDRMGPDTVRRTAEEAIRVSTDLGDDRGLGRANYLLASVSFVLGQSGAGLESLERGLEHAQKADDVRTIRGCVGDMGYVFLYDATPAAAALERLSELASTFPDARASVLGPMAAMSAMLDRFDEARRLLEERRGLAEEFGQRWALAQTEWWAGFVETLAEQLADAESHLSEAHAIASEMGIKRMAGQVAGDLAEVVYELGRHEEAFEIAKELRTNPPGEDVQALNIWRGVYGKVLAARGLGHEAEHVVRMGVSLGERVGAPILAGRFLMDLAEVLRLSGKSDEALEVIDEAIRCYVAKGSLPSVRAAERARELLAAGD